MMIRFFAVWACCLGMLLGLVGCTQQDSSSPGFYSRPVREDVEIPAFPVKVDLNIEAQGRPVNRLLLGNNIQWTDGGDGLLKAGTLDFSVPVIQQAQALKPTVLRYPGGAQADLYQWKNGTGSLSERRDSTHAFRQQNEKILFGTRELLLLCRQWGAEPMITVNTITATPQDAAGWVEAVNVKGFRDDAGKPLPKVTYWEVGNEPYLLEPPHAISAGEFARRVNAFIPAMKKADPGIHVGIPLRSDRLGALKDANRQPGFNETLLRELSAPIDFAAVHNAYFPVLTDDLSPDSTNLFRATMAATRAVEADLNATRARLDKRFPSRAIPLAVTEYNALFSVGHEQTDRLVATPAGALYVADVLRILVGRPDILMANYWSLSGNGHFGAVGTDGTRRPAFDVLRLYNMLLQGNYLPLKVDSPVFSSPAVGGVPAYEKLPVVVGLATRQQQWVRVLLMNKDPAAPAEVSLDLAKVPIKEWVAFEELTSRDVWSNAPFEPANGRLMDTKGILKFQLEPHSLILLQFELR